MALYYLEAITSRVVARHHQQQIAVNMAMFEQKQQKKNTHRALALDKWDHQCTFSFSRHFILILTNRGEKSWGFLCEGIVIEPTKYGKRINFDFNHVRSIEYYVKITSGGGQLRNVLIQKWSFSMHYKGFSWNEKSVSEDVDTNELNGSCVQYLF